MSISLEDLCDYPLAVRFISWLKDKEIIYIRVKSPFSQGDNIDFYRYDQEYGVYRFSESNSEIENLISSDFYPYMKFKIESENKIDDNEHEDLRKAKKKHRQSLLSKLQNQLLNSSGKKRVLKEICNNMPMPERKLDLDEKLKLSINFKNGIFFFSKVKQKKDGSLDISKAFRKRKPTDMVSQTLNYNFEMPNKKIEKRKKYFDEFFSKVLPNEDSREHYLNFLAYCITGIIKWRFFMVMAGYMAGNSKSTCLKIHDLAFHIYCMKAPKDLLDERQSDETFRVLIEMKVNPIRLLYREETSDKKQDVEKLKSIADGGKVKIKQLYKTKLETIDVGCKLINALNRDQKLPSDEGVKRSGTQVSFEQKFVLPNEYEQEKKKGTKNLHIADTSIIETVTNNDTYKLAYFYILLPKVINIIKNGYQPSLKARELFKDSMEAYQPFNTEFQRHFEVTGNEKDRLLRDSVVEILNSKRKIGSPESIVRELKRLGIKYEKDKRINGIKGVFVGIKKVSESVFQYDDDDTDSDDGEANLEDILNNLDENKLKELMEMIKEKLKPEKKMVDYFKNGHTKIPI